jgi:long-chain acyl-CoA synthetase
MIDTDISTPHDAPWRAAYNKAGIAPELNPPTHASLAALVHEACSRYAQSAPKQAAFTCVVPNGMNGSLRFAEVDALSDAFAGYLRGVLGLQAGDRVAVQLPNCLAYPVVAFGVFKAGCVLVNTNPLYTEKEMAHQLKDAGAQALVIIDMFADKLPAVLQATGLKLFEQLNRCDVGLELGFGAASSNVLL